MTGGQIEQPIGKERVGDNILSCWIRIRKQRKEQTLEYYKIIKDVDEYVLIS